MPKGGPDGGDGGHGGDVVLVGRPRPARPVGFFHRSTRFEAKRGRHGEGSNKRGAGRRRRRSSASPSGRRCSTRTAACSPTSRIRAPGWLPPTAAAAAPATAASPRRPTRRRASPSSARAGEEAALELRLKLLADAALLGFPNAGKSSLLRRISNAKPKVAEYPFTTIAPVLGTVEAPDGRQLTVADVPGLLEGASEGVGLGDEFLAHLERARLFLHVIDAQEDAEARFRAIDRELAAYGAGLAERPQIVVLNKIDLVAEPPAFDVEDPRILGVVPTSAATGAGIDRAEAPALRARPGERAAPRPEERRARRLPRLPPAPAAPAPVPHLPHAGRLSRARRGDRGGAPRAPAIKPDAVVEFEDA